MSIHGSKYKKLSEGTESYILSGEIFNRYVSIAESLHAEPKSSRLYRKYIAELEMQGIITSYESGKGIRGHTKLIKLSYQPGKIKELIEKGILRDNGTEAH